MSYINIFLLILVFAFQPTNSYADPHAPSRSLQVKLLETSNLVDETRGFDELDKDMLIIRSKTHTIESLTQKYPQLPKDKLMKLKEKVMELK